MRKYCIQITSMDTTPAVSMNITLPSGFQLFELHRLTGCVFRLKGTGNGYEFQTENGDYSSSLYCPEDGLFSADGITLEDCLSESGETMIYVRDLKKCFRYQITLIHIL